MAGVDTFLENMKSGDGFTVQKSMDDGNCYRIEYERLIATDGWTTRHKQAMHVWILYPSEMSVQGVLVDHLLHVQKMIEEKCERERFDDEGG